MTKSWQIDTAHESGKPEKQTDQRGTILVSRLGRVHPADDGQRIVNP